jgi:hypothetical protein
MLITALLRLTLLQQSEQGQTTPEFAAIGKELKAWSRKPSVLRNHSWE